MLVFLAVVVCVMSAGVGAAAVITVDDSGGADFTSIQAAVDAADDGDTIEVRSGTYVENVDVGKRITLRGEGASVVTVQAANSNDHVFDVTADWVNISWVKAYGATASGKAGIYVGDGIAHSNISNNAASNNYYGIYLDRSNNNILTENTPSKNYMHGIRLAYSSNNTLLNNIVSSDNGCAILLYASVDNRLINNDVSNSFQGIYMYTSSNDNLVSGNTASGNQLCGIYLEGNNNTITGNIASNNGDFGILLESSGNNILYHNNLIDNARNTYDPGTNQWDSGSEGNYYSDYTGTDSNSDGIGDTPYPIPGGSSVDRYPLMAPPTPPPSDYEGKLLRQTGDLEVYLIENDKKRHFTSPEALEWNGYSFDNVIEVSLDVMNSFEPGADITITRAIINKYNDLGGEATFGEPAGTGEQSGYPDNAGVVCTYVNFQNGAIEYFTNGDQAGNVYAILNPFFDKWASMGYGKSVLGYPICNMSYTQTSSFGTPFKYQNFINGTERGALEYNLSSGEVFEIHGAIYATWSAMDYANSVLGLVTSDERYATPSFKGTTGRVSDFENGHLHWHSSGDHYMVTYMTYGELDELYVSMGGTASWLGFPVMDQEDRGGYGYCEFEEGYIEWDVVSGEYIAKKFGITDGLVAEWHFDEGSGNILTDTSGNGNNGTIYGATWTTDGKFGSALQFDGVNDYVEVLDSPELSGGTGKNMTVEFWFNSNKQNGHIITKWKDVSYEDWGMSIGAVGPGLFFWYESGGNDRRFYGGTIEEGVWHHGAFTFKRSTGSNNAKVTLYLDGEELDLINFDGVAPDKLYDMPDTSAPVSIGYSGKYYNSGFFDGRIDEIKIYNKVLSADEIKAEYDKSSNDTSPPSSIRDLLSDSGSSWINWTWTNPSDSDFNHTMVYLDGKFVNNTSDLYFNSTDLLQSTLHTIGTRTVDLSGNVNETWVNDTAMTTGELSGGLSIKISKPSSYSFYPVGETVEFNVAVTDQIGNPVTSGISAYADLSGPNSTSRRVILSEDAGNFVGEYTVKGDDARGIWTVNINAFNATSSGQASLKLFFTGAYFIQPYTDLRSYLLGETANFTAKVVKPVGSSQPLTDKNLSLNISVYQFNTTTLVSGPVEMVFDDTTGKFHGDVNTGLLGSGLFSVLFSGRDTDGNIETESLTIGVSEDFNIIVGTDKMYYDRNELVNIHGSMEFIDGTPLSNTDVNLQIFLKGFMRSYTATTNETGGFNYTFQPFATEAGNYTITSTAVNLGLQRTAENHFTIHGLYLALPSGTLNMVENSTKDIEFILYNLGETTLTGITATVNDPDVSDNVDATIVTTVPNELQPSESAYIILNVSAGTPVPENAAFFITVSTDQMSDETSELDVNLFSPNPVVVLEPDNIAVGLNQNQTALKTVTISNTGYGVLRNLTLTQPGYNWMRITSNTTIGDLKPGENTSFDIHIHSYNASLGTYNDTVSITSDNHENVVVDLSVSITDQTYGSLLFYVENELGQNISGASISLIDDTLYQEYTTITNSTGYALMNELPTGRYIYEVSSSGDNTLSQLNSVVVEPMEQSRKVNVTMQLSFIDFEWDVIPSTIDDWYQIVLNMTFETDVPVPIIVAFPPYLEYNMNPGDVQSGTLTVANLGLVSLFDVSITPYINNNVQFTPIVSNIEELKAKSSVQIPYTIELAPSASSCDGFTGKINIKGKYIHFINGKGVASYTGTTVPLFVKTPTCEPPEIGTGTIIGTVTDASDGSQIDNARVVAGRYYIDTDSSGSYTLKGVKSRTYTITAYKDGYYPISKTVVVTKDTTETVNFQLTPITTGPIIGIVTNAIDGTPIEGARVAAGGRSDATDDSGSYTLSDILTGSHTITASKRGFYKSSTTVLVTEDNTAVVNFQLTPIPETVYGSISVMVSDIDTDEPLPFALIVTNGGFDFTDESGRYTITGVPVGSNSVIASKAWYHSASKTVQVYEDCTTIVNFQLKKIIIPPVPIPDCECISGTPPVIWVYKGHSFKNIIPPPTTPSKMLVENCNDEGTIEFSDAYAATISLNSLWIPSLSVNIGTILSSVYNIPVGDIWHNEFIPKQIDPNEETMLDVENMSRFFSDMESFGITLPIPDIFGGALGFVYGPYPYDTSRNCLKIIPLGGMEIKEGSVNIVFPPWPPWPPWPDGDSDDGLDPVPPWRPPVFTETIHEIVQLSISQNATMERDAFWAGLGIRNRMPDTNIDNVGVSLHISNENGSANDKFFIRAPRLEDISDIDGSGTISPLQLAKAQWLIIPKPGAGGVTGQTYNISADIAYSVDGTNFWVTTENVEVLVNPQPQLILDYYLPSDVIGNSPFKLAVMVTNDGYGTARNFSIETAQPVIYNPSGLMIDFEIIRSALQGEERSDSLKINFGDLSPGESKLAWWEMVVSMDGTFTEFIGDYTHSSELGGMETSLIKQLNTNIIHREIETGDVNYSFLVTPKDDETHYLLLDSNSGGSTPVSIANYTIVSGPTLGNPNLNVNIEDLTGQWVIVSIEDPYDNKVPILKVIRDSDGSEIPFFNYWMRDGRILIVDHYVEGFDGKYSIQFDYPLILDTTFRPNPNGYQFANFGSDNYSWEIFRITYGADEVEVDGQPLPRALNFSEKYYRHAGKGGSCFGMSASSLLLYHNNLKSWDLAGQTSSINPGINRSLDSADSCIGGIPIPPDFNDNGVCDPSPRTWGVFSQFMSTPSDWVEYYQPLQYSATSLADRAKFKGPITVYNELKLRMVSGNWIEDPMVIGIEWKKTDGNITGHAIVPYRIEEAPDHMSGEVFIYDSVYPDSERSIQFDLVTGTARDSDWTLNNLSNVAAVSLSAIQSEPQIPEGFESVTSHGHLLYTDAIERHLGYYGGEFKDEIPNTSRIIPYGQIKGDQNPETYYISNLQLKRELYGIDDGIAIVSILRPNTLIVADVQVSPGSVDELLVPLDGSSVEFISGGGTSLLSLMLDREKTDFARLASINVSGIESGSAIQLLFSDDLGKVGVINNGLQNGYTIYLEQIGLNHSSYRSPKPVIIEETSSAWFIPSNWNDIPNNPIVVEHDIGNDGTIDYTEILPSQDTTPPAGIANLQHTAATTYLNWTWTDPADLDFNHTEIYFNAFFQTNVIKGVHHFNATELDPDTSYEIGTRTVDTNGNTNLTWVNNTATTLPLLDIIPPVITITSLVNNITYNIDLVNLNYSVNEPTTWQGYSPDGAANITLQENITLTNLTDGLHTLTVYANDTSGNMNLSTVWFTIDTKPPVINTVTLNTTTPTPGEDIIVTVNTTDNIAVTSVTTNGIELTHKGENIWNEIITAIEGTHSVNISASDAAVNIAWNNSTSYTTTTPDTPPQPLTFY